jgi:hypothetical protein
MVREGEIALNRNGKNLLNLKWQMSSEIFLCIEIYINVHGLLIIVYIMVNKKSLNTVQDTKHIQD